MTALVINVCMELRNPQKRRKQNYFQDGRWASRPKGRSTLMHCLPEFYVSTAYWDRHCRYHEQDLLRQQSQQQKEEPPTTSQVTEAARRRGNLLDTEDGQRAIANAVIELHELIRCDMPYRLHRQLHVLQSDKNSTCFETDCQGVYDCYKSINWASDA